jgi:phenylacetic acid degradation operon negative regulatory protein
MSLSPPLLDAFHARTPIRAGSLVVTVFGDAVAPRGGELSLASLVEIMAAFRIGPGVVRTALSRLVAEGWFERRRLGRNSFYRLSASGRAAFETATEKIYGGTHHRWDGAFAMILLDQNGARGQARAKLEALGFGAISPDLLIAPTDLSTVQLDTGVRLEARPVEADDARRLAERAWPIAALAQRYGAFIRLFAPAHEALRSGDGPADLDALVVRVLLIHEYRRIVLRDPLLPSELLPHPWAGDEARALCGAIYRAVAPAAERWLGAHATTETGALPPAEPAFSDRFRDLSRPGAHVTKNLDERAIT